LKIKRSGFGFGEMVLKIYGEGCQRNVEGKKNFKWKVGKRQIKYLPLFKFYCPSLCIFVS